MKNKEINSSIDFLGIMASLLCAIHCALLPFLLSMASLAGLHFLANPWIEYAVLGLSLILVLFSLLPAYKNHHQQLTPILTVIIGFSLILIGQFSPDKFEIIYTSMGAVIVAVAHGFNLHYMKENNKNKPNN